MDFLCQEHVVRRVDSVISEVGGNTGRTVGMGEGYDHGWLGAMTISEGHNHKWVRATTMND